MGHWAVFKHFLDTSHPLQWTGSRDQREKMVVQINRHGMAI